MIVKMKKIHVLVQKKDQIVSLEQLRDLGIVHVEHQKDVADASLSGLIDDMRLMEQAAGVLGGIKSESAQKGLDDGLVMAQKIMGITQQRTELKDDMFKRQVLINHWAPWGEFDLADIEAFAKKGLIVRLCEIPVSEECTHLEDVIVETVFHDGGVARNVVISHEDQDLPFETVPLPLEGLKQMREHQARDQKQLQVLEQELESLCCYNQAFDAQLAIQMEKIRFQEVSLGLREEGALTLLKGYCPFDLIERLEKTATANHWGLVVEDPGEDDQVPTLLRNPGWIKIIDPVLKMINIVPGFKEFDVSFLFLIFFTLFFGMLIGDAGYGLVFLLLTGFAQFKMGKNVENKGPFLLMYVLSGVTVIYGGLTATFFGQQWLSPYVKPLVPWLNDTENVQNLCFLIGAVHLSIAHLWCAAKKWPSLELARDVGWFLIIWVMFFMTKVLVLGAAAPGFLMPLLIVGCVLILFIPKFKMAPTFPLDVINCFTDVVSYIRLFAVGLATVAVADAANDMTIGWVIFLHVLNILLAAMAILVHGLRLNVLEFSGHLGMEWAGFQYNPFKKTKSLES